ncbi:unnamed protein product [Bursaphelenchus okinawaensis]|uniref:glutathione transferase n=1 Tax=Bursaphelenchus okinawaensis TaxID=465554 RepID=A0A811KLT5_9BILA|nr:unnamed protein product [Bursaphelenchus okinawaensis]CAG9105673.1 unnamed protein product [Bursaphelenchus okinawaensis]
MVQYKLTYGDARGLGEPARLVLHYAGVQFEDDRLSDFSVVETIRDLPVLTIDGTTKLAQSQAICRFLARKHGLAGKDDVEQALVDSYGDFLMDLMTNLRPYFIFLRTGEGDKEKTLSDAKTYIETKWEKYFNKIVEGSGSGFLAKSGVTWPDFIVANFYETCKNLEFAPILNIKHFKTVHDSVKALPQLKEYFANRKQTQF